MITTNNGTVELVVNADDFGYFECVSRGIAEAAERGAITATGMLANGPGLERQVEWVAPFEDLDFGVHLNLTWGRPLTGAMAARLERWNRKFPGLGVMTALIACGSVERDLIRREWRAQIERCRQASGRLAFLNSHQHIHMLPLLFPLATDLAREYGISQVRVTRGEWRLPLSASALIRNALLDGMRLLNQLGTSASYDKPRLLGLNDSGRLDIERLGPLLRRLKPGRTYELMCHPGYFDPAEVDDPKLISYHDWQGEFDLLTGSALHSLCRELDIRLVNFRACSRGLSVGN